MLVVLAPERLIASSVRRLELLELPDLLTRPAAAAVSEMENIGEPILKLGSLCFLKKMNNVKMDVGTIW